MESDTGRQVGERLMCCGVGSGSVDRHVRQFTQEVQGGEKWVTHCLYHMVSGRAFVTTPAFNMGVGHFKRGLDVGIWQPQVSVIRCGLQGRKW